MTAAHRAAAADPAVAAMHAETARANAEIRARAAAAEELLEELRYRADRLFGPDADGLTLTARGGFFGAWTYRDAAYDGCGRDMVAYLDDDLDALDERLLSDLLGAYAEVGPPENVRRGYSGRTLVHLNP
jgi:hypothetical protein